MAIQRMSVILSVFTAGDVLSGTVGEDATGVESEGSVV